MEFENALGVARQIADALEAAHEEGIVHRDLKASNIRIKPDGTGKVLDFGLAKMGAVSAGEVSDNCPTVTLGATQLGIAGGRVPGATFHASTPKFLFQAPIFGGGTTTSNHYLGCIAGWAALLDQQLRCRLCNRVDYRGAELGGGVEEVRPASWPASESEVRAWARLHN